jgi:hypothetical protein
LRLQVPSLSIASPKGKKVSLRAGFFLSRIKCCLVCKEGFSDFTHEWKRHNPYPNVSM